MIRIRTDYIRPFSIMAILIFTFLLNGCYVFSAFQSARTLKRGEISATPSASFISFHGDRESENMTNNYGLQLGYGVWDRLNLTGRYETLRIAANGDLFSEHGYHYADIGLKYSVIPNRVAIGLPMGRLFGNDGFGDDEVFFDGDAMWQMHPSLFLTLPSEHVDLNLSTRYLVFFSDSDMDNLLAFNIGMGFHLLPSKISPVKISLLPEMGLLFNPGEDGNFFNIGFGLEFKI